MMRKMAPKQQLDKAAWKWAETTDPTKVTQDHIETAYRVKLKPCKLGTCRRNCKGNPNCLNGLGENLWLGEIDDDSWHEIEDPNNERRQEGSFVGLKNLGATCYVNTLLQVWFHNSTLRRALYQWIPDKTKTAKKSSTVGLLSNTTTETDNIASTSSQNNNSVVKPTETKKVKSSSNYTDVSCKVNSQIKKDEIETIEIGSGDVTDNSTSNMKPRPSPKKELPQLTTADEPPTTVCGHLQLIFALLEHSKRRYIDPSAFIDCLGLDAALQQDAQEFSKLLMSLLEDMLQQQQQIESVRNVIQQQFCGEYAYVTRCNTCGGISQRPSRFYELDLNIQGHKELSECLQEFLQVEKLEGSNQYLCERCHFTKQNASRRIQLHTLPPVLNLQLLRFIFDRNTGHKKKLNSYIQFPEVLDMTPYLVTQERQVIYDLSAVLIHTGPSAYSGHYIAHIKDKNTGSWYKFNDEEIKKMEGKNLKLGSEDDIQDGGPKPPKKPKFMKGFHASRNAYMLVYKIRESENSTLYQLLQGQLAMLNARYQLLQGQLAMLNARYQLLQGQLAMLNARYQLLQGQLAMLNARFQLLQGQLAMLNARYQLLQGQLAMLKARYQLLQDQSTQESKMSQESAVNIPEDDCDDEDFDFNEDIICEHDGFNLTFVSNEVWKRLRHYFPDAPQFSASTPSCLVCQRTDQEDEQNSEFRKITATEQKNALPQLYHDRNRPAWNKRDVSSLYVVSQHFVEEWRKFIKQPLRYFPVSKVDNSQFLCSHGGLSFLPHVPDDGNSHMVVYVWPHEWELIVDSFKIDHIIKITQHYGEDGKTKTFTSQPEICEECIAMRISKEEMESKDYTDEVIYVRKLTDSKKPNLSMLESMEDPADVSDSNLKEDSDPDFTQNQSHKKKEKISSSDKQVKRRSSRHRRTRGEKQITVSASNTLKELKVQVMGLFSVAPFDQHLMFESGKNITGDVSTLGDLGIQPGDVLYLKVDLPCDDPLLMDDIMKACAPEEGFKGTSLLRN
uniref:ubiquitinyl hydrolase 1 n=1 Tax=Saccoglossus kowalevskii TaxID=10224 RepID=A0ABM0LVY2_SACKO|nr:PREDICTED: ubiquitin carboxyl-terminal hydrolase 48-like [Saccoglossus kowalevskii]